MATEKLADKLERLSKLAKSDPKPESEPETEPSTLKFQVEVIPPRFALNFPHVVCDVWYSMMTDKGIHKPDIAVYQFLSFNLNTSTAQTHRLSRREIMNGTGLSDQSVRKSLKKLTEKGYLKVIENGRSIDGLVSFVLLPI